MPSAIIRMHQMPIGTRCNLDQFMGSRQGCLPFHSLIMTLTLDDVICVYPREDAGEEGVYKIVILMRSFNVVHHRYESREDRDKDYAIWKKHFYKD